MRGTMLFLVLLFLGCEQTSGVVVTVKGLRDVSEFRVLQVTVQHDQEAPRRLDDFTRGGLTLDSDDTARLGLVLPGEARGRLRVTVTALSDGAIVLGQGTAEAELGARRVELEVTLVRQEISQMGVTLTIKGLRGVPEFRTLQVTLQHGEEAPQRLDDFAREGLMIDGGDTARLGLMLPGETRGRLRVTVAALPDGAFVLGQGRAEAELGERPVEMVVTLARQEICSQSGWCWETPTPSGRQIHALWGSAKDDVWAAGRFGTLLHYDGRVWSKVPLPEEAGEPDLFALWGSGRDDVWAVGGIYNAADSNFPWGVVLRYDSRDGRGWRVVARNKDWKSLSGVWGGKAGEVWVAGVRRVPLPESPPKSPPEAFLLRCTAMGCDEKPVLLSEVLGRQLKGDQELISLWSAGPGSPLWAVGWWRDVDMAGMEKGIVLRYRDDMWKLVHEFDSPVARVWGSGEHVWVGSLIHDPYPFFVGPKKIWRVVPGSDGAAWEDLIGKADGAGFPLWDDGGKHWGLRDGRVASKPRSFDVNWGMGETGQGISALFGFAPDDIWAAGEDGQLLHFDGGSWGGRGSLPLASGPVPGPVPALRGMFGTKADSAWAVGDGGTILHFNGSAWTAEASGTMEDLRGVWGFGADAWAVGMKGTVLRRSKDGWVREQVPMMDDLYDIWGTGPGDLWAVGDGGTILRWDGDGAGWSVARAKGSGPRLLSLWGFGKARWAVGCNEPNPDLSMVRLAAGSWQDVTPPEPTDRCYDAVWFADENKILVLVRANSSLYQYDVPTGKWTRTRASSTGRCIGSKGDLWCPAGIMGIGRGDVDGGDDAWMTFDVGAVSGRAPYGNLFRVDNDIWLYGFGNIIHCRRGDACAAPRR